MPAQLNFLSAARITGIMQGLQDVRLLPQQLVWNSRIGDVSAMDDEIMARFIGTLLISDLVADDAKAVVYSQGKFQFEHVKIPNLKHGIAMNQSALNQYRKLVGQYSAPEDMGIFTGWENRTIQSLLLGISQRKEALFVAMLTDGLNYDRLGIKMVNVTWGMPSDLKVTPATPWSTAASATPLTDIRTVARIGRIRYGINYNRVTMSTAAFQLMVNTTEFQNQAKIFGWGLVNVTPTIPLQSDAMLKDLASKLLDNMTIELYDARYWSQDVNGMITSQPFLPINKVIVTDSRNDNNNQVMDFANGIVTESIVANATKLINLSGGGLPVSYGPISYATAPPDLNPPEITYWGVARGFPRKHLLQASAVLDVGTVVETIAVGVPFPA